MARITPRLRLTWWDLSTAINCARYDAIEDKRRMRVVREDGEDECGPYRFRIVPAPGVAEPCS